MFTDSTRHLGVLHEHRCGNFIDSYLVNEQLFISVEVGFHDIYLLFYGLRNLYNLLFVAPGRYRIFVNIG